MSESNLFDVSCFHPFSIAIDGPSGAGKSSISDIVASRLHILHLDTGAMYRAMGLACLNDKVDIGDEKSVIDYINQKGFNIRIQFDGEKQYTYLNGLNVSEDIRKQEIGFAASTVSKYSIVRSGMLSLQRQYARSQSVLLDGRDIGTVVLPDADVKIYLTASDTVRAFRRQCQLKRYGYKRDYFEILSEIRLRDQQDITREIAPLKQAEDAILVDSSEMTFDETAELVLSIIFDKLVEKKV